MKTDKNVLLFYPYVGQRLQDCGFFVKIIWKDCGAFGLKHLIFIRRQVSNIFVSI